MKPEKHCGAYFHIRSCLPLTIFYF